MNLLTKNKTTNELINMLELERKIDKLENKVNILFVFVGVIAGNSGIELFKAINIEQVKTTLIIFFNSYIINIFNNLF